MLNATAPSKSDEGQLEVIDFSVPQPIEQSVAYIKELLGHDVELYAIAYSAGSNHLIKYLGHQSENCGFKAAVSISGVFDVLTAGI